MTTPDPAHIDAVAKVMEGRDVWVGFRDEAGDDDCANGTIDASDLRDLAKWILDSTDPAVHAAMLDALTRHGVLTEERGGAGVINPNPAMLLRRRLVTPWEVDP